MISSSLRISLALVLYGTSLMGDEFEVTADFLQMDYMERDTLGYKLDGEKTRGIAGFSIVSTWDTGHGWLAPQSALRLEYQRFNGTTDYTGSTLGGTGGYGSLKSKTSNTISDLGFVYQEGHDYGNISLFILAGAGYRLWERQLSTIQKEDYSFGYLQTGLGGWLKLAPELAVGFEGRYKAALSPQMRDSYTGYTYDLGNVNGLSLSLPIVYRLSDQWDMVTKYTYQRWDFEKSNSHSYNGNVYYEPDSITRNHILSIGLSHPW